MRAEIRVASRESELHAALALREEVFCGEQGVPPALERDGRDAGALHLIALIDGTLAGTCRLLFDDEIARLGRMAVRPGLRGQGVGRALLDAAAGAARDRGARRIELHAQRGDAERLYRRAGFRVRGEPFVEAGIPHVAMHRPP